ncbi:MAG: L-histidine N(alpha)-methyltransferase [Bacteroidales bacterium]|nr:L-histidine N(alpha)-methyltransferase [Bacteroidales bacterium]
MNYIEEQIISIGKIRIENHLADIGIDAVKEEIIKGLCAPEKYISSKFFYDEKGSRLFEQITQLDEYYPTRTEKSILSTFIKNANINFQNLSIIELGSGDSSKIKLLLKQIPVELLKSIRYFPVDISQSAILKSSEELIKEFDLESITGIVADFVHQFSVLPKAGKRLFCFFGSTIGNFTKKEQNRFITELGNEMQTGDAFLLGMDMVKDITVLENAYNDIKGVTAAFNKNILNVINLLCNANFNVDDFEHIAFYNQAENRIEMHLKALKEMDISLNSGLDTLHFIKGEKIHTENSHKFTDKDVEIIGEYGNFHLKNVFTDKNKWFKLVYFEKK